MFVLGCSKKVDVPSCALVPITPTLTHADFKQFTLLGPKVNGAISSVFVQDDYAYLEAGSSLVILDVHNPMQPVRLGVYPGGTTPIKVEGDYAYAYWDEGLRILDISNPDNLVEVGCLEGSNLELQGAIFSESHAYLPKGEEGLRIYDVSELTSPIEVAFYQSNSLPELWWRTPPGERLPRPDYIPSEPMLALDVAISGQYAYLGEGRVGIDSFYGGQLTVLNVSNPRRPKRVGVYTMPQNTAAMKVILDGSYAFVSTFSMYEAQLTVVLDISNPENPVEVASFPTGALLAVYKGFAYFHDYKSGLVVWDVSNPASSHLVGQIELPLIVAGRYGGAAVIIEDIAFVDNYAYIAIEYDGLHILDISDPTNAKEVSAIHYDILPEAQFHAISNNTAYLGTSGGNIRVLDISETNSLPLLGYVEGLGAEDIAVSDNIGYVARGEEGFSLIDVSDLENISIINTYDLENFQANSIVSQDDLLFILEEDVGLHIFDATDHSNLISLSTVNLNVTSYDDVAVWNDYVYVAMGENAGELRVIDVSESTRPREVTRIKYPEFFTSIAANDSYIYVVTSWDLITVFDVQNPDSPRQISVHDSENFLNDIHLEDGVLYLALRYGGGIAVVELEAP